jgi:excisionase family DNA binding protein
MAGASAVAGSERLTPAQAARLLGVTPDTVRKMADAGQLRHERTPLGRLLDLHDVERLVDERRRAARRQPQAVAGAASIAHAPVPAVVEPVTASSDPSTVMGAARMEETLRTAELARRPETEMAAPAPIAGGGVLLSRRSRRTLTA